MYMYECIFASWSGFVCWMYLLYMLLLARYLCCSQHRQMLSLMCMHLSGYTYYYKHSCHSPIHVQLEHYCQCKPSVLWFFLVAIWKQRSKMHKLSWTKQKRFSLQRANRTMHFKVVRSKLSDRPLLARKRGFAGKHWWTRVSCAQWLWGVLGS